MALSCLIVVVVLVGYSAGQVLELDDANFTQHIKASPLVLVDFYVPWCPHCKELEPQFTAAAEDLAATQTSVRMAKVNCDLSNTATKETCRSNNVRFLPWMVLFRNGKSFKSYGELKRDEATIVKFMNTAVQNPSLLETLQDSKPPRMQPKDTCDDLASKAHGAEPDPDSPAVLNLNDTNFNETINKNEYVLVDIYAPWCSDCQRLNPLFDIAALQLRDDNPSLRFAKVLCDKGHQETYSVCGEAHLKFFPWVVLYHNGKQVKVYPFENVPDTNTIFDFIEGGMRDSPPNPENKKLPETIRKTRKSLDKQGKNAGENKGKSEADKQASEEGEDQTQVLHLDDKNFDAAIKKHAFVLVDFFAPWCFHCKTMAPLYDEAAKELRESHESVRLAKVDCTKTNIATVETCRKYKIKFLPTILLFQDGKYVDEFDNSKRTKETIVGYINDAVADAAPSKKINDSKNKKKKKKHHKHKHHKANNDAKPTEKMDVKETGMKETSGNASVPMKAANQNKTEDNAVPVVKTAENLQQIIQEVQPEEIKGTAEASKGNATAETVGNPIEITQITKDNKSADNTAAKAVENPVQEAQGTKTEETPNIQDTNVKNTPKIQDTKVEEPPKIQEPKPANGASSAADVIQAVAQNMLKALNLAKPAEVKAAAKEESKIQDTPGAKLEYSLPQVVNDLHQVAQDLHQVTQDLHKMADQQPAFGRLMNELQSFVETKKKDSISDPSS